MAASGDDNKIPIPDSLRRALSSEGRDLLRQAIDDGRVGIPATELLAAIESDDVLQLKRVLKGGVNVDCTTILKKKQHPGNVSGGTMTALMLACMLKHNSIANVAPSRCERACAPPAQRRDRDVRVRLRRKR
mmetsp:Transcript_90610/g.258859  ORF Transcript_90610/g.258859 Transcript_90610/m.258859 type:complete len:132 (+) Transcript_90610:167-562(+)